MRTRGLLTALALAVSSMVVAGPVPATAAVVRGVSAEQAKTDQDFVRWLSTSDYRAQVRDAARAALGSDGSVAAFLASGFRVAAGRYEQIRVGHVDFATRMVITHPAAKSPWVHAAGRRALQGTDAELATFARTEYAAALKRDKKKVTLTRDRVRQGDRDAVVRLRDGDPGTQVRAWAGHAAAVGASDAEVAEFLTHCWASSAGLDLQWHRQRSADDEVRWRAQVRVLVAEAETAEKAAQRATGSQREQARADAARAWAAVGAQTVEPRAAWAAALQVAQRQTETWSRSAAGPRSRIVEEAAPGMHKQWSAQLNNAVAQAASWQALHDQAAAAELALKAPAAPTA
ncbi:hypothetical protein [Actinoplanes sp. NPDC051859]|uniref:hypothetical protein n=1 Tax=Actinoplanes sp. NPDC051859 TaxID=3363909 RepID=UPI0037935CD4